VEGDVQVQTKRALENLSAVLLAAGSSLGQVVKTTVFLATMDDFASMNEVYAGFFPSDPPARSTIAVAALPKGALVEIEAIAIRMAQ
jgi:2-iminobutanoate/2-iminopropanoate deaminase